MEFTVPGVIRLIASLLWIIGIENLASVRTKETIGTNSAFFNSVPICLSEIARFTFSWSGIGLNASLKCLLLFFTSLNTGIVLRLTMTKSFLIPVGFVNLIGLECDCDCEDKLFILLIRDWIVLIVYLSDFLLFVGNLVFTNMSRVVCFSTPLFLNTVWIGCSSVSEFWLLHTIIGSSVSSDFCDVIGFEWSNWPFDSSKHVDWVAEWSIELDTLNWLTLNEDIKHLLGVLKIGLWYIDDINIV